MTPPARVVSVLVFIAAVAMSCRSPDAIDRLVAEISTTDPESQRTGFVPVALPATASVEDVVRRAMGTTLIREIVTTREEHFKQPSPSVTAALVQTVDEGGKIVLLFYMGDHLGWWTQVYGAD